MPIPGIPPIIIELDEVVVVVVDDYCYIMPPIIPGIYMPMPGIPPIIGCCIPIPIIPGCCIMPIPGICMPIMFI